jgi:hypothetical protein
MGLRGAGAKKPIKRGARSAQQSAWKRKRGRVARVISFLESLPITKGIYAGRLKSDRAAQERFARCMIEYFPRDPAS